MKVDVEERETDFRSECLSKVRTTGIIVRRLLFVITRSLHCICSQRTKQIVGIDRGYITVHLVLVVALNAG